MTPPFSALSPEESFLCQASRTTLQTTSANSAAYSSFSVQHNAAELISSLSNNGSTAKFAYITLLTRDSYLIGVQCLYRSLQSVQSKHPLIVMYTPETLTPHAASTLQAEGCIMRPVKPYLPAVDHSLYKNACYSDCWTKLLMWEIEEYDLLVYLDADMLVLKNIDHLFQLPQLAALPSSEHSPLPLPVLWAVPDCAAGRETEEERAQCSLLPQNLKINGKNSYFNAGMFIFAPSTAQLHKFHQTLSSGTCPIQGYAEQDFLNHYFQDTWKPLSTLFNLQKGIRGHHPELWVPEEAFIIHYTDCKPWHGRDHPENLEYREIVNWWWDIYNSKVGLKV
jgi:inositol 3-alpha-galactosyltransferase